MVRPIRRRTTCAAAAMVLVCLAAPAADVVVRDAAGSVPGSGRTAELLAPDDLAQKTVVVAGPAPVHAGAGGKPSPWGAVVDPDDRVDEITSESNRT